MKKLLALVCIAAIGASVFAEEPVNVYFDANRLIEEDLFGNWHELTETARFLSPAQKNTLYTAHKKDAVIPFLANWFVGFGVGSALQGDITGFTTVLLLDVAGTAFFVYGFQPIFQFSNGPDPSDTEEYLAYSDEMNRRMNRNIPFLLAGCGFFLASGIFSLVRPWTYAASWNSALDSALNSGADAAVSFFPLSDGQSLGFGVRIDL